MTQPAERSAASQEVARPTSPWLRLLTVCATLSVAVGIGALAVNLAEVLGVDRKVLQGTGFVVSFTTVTVLLVVWALQALAVFTTQRVIHRRPFLDLGFRAPALKHLAIGSAVGLATWMAPEAGDLLTGAKTIEWSVPAGVSPLALIGYYCFFLFLLTGNSFAEELVFRCYPIQQFRDGTGMMVAAIAVSALVFASAHFVIGEFSLGRLIVMVAGACLYSVVYVWYRSIWLVIGLHNASNFVPFTISGNWKVGGLFTLSGQSTSSLAVLLHLCAPILLILLFYRFRPRPAVASPR